MASTALIGPALPAAADVESATPAATIQIPHSTLPSCLVTGDFTVFVWVRTPESIPTGGAFLQAPVLVELSAPNEHTVRARLTRKAGTLVRAPGFPTLGNTGELPTLTAEAAFDFPRGEWTLLAISYIRAEGRLRLWARAQSVSTAEATATSPAFLALNPGPAQAALSIGMHPYGLYGFVGVYGPVAIRDHAIARPDFDEVFESRRYLAVYDLTNVARGGRMTGSPGCKWMVHHAMTTQPFDGGVGGPMPSRAALIDGPVTRSNYHIFDAARTPGQATQTAFRWVYPILTAHGFTYRSHREGPLDGFFIPDLPQSGTPVTAVWRYAPVTRQLVTGPQRPLRVMVSSNSRGVKRFDGSGLSPGNWAHGFIDLDRSRVSGIFFRPAISDAQNGHPWFGFDTSAQAPRQSPQGVSTLENPPQTWGDFTRFFTGGGGNGRGPGAAVRIAPGAFMSMRCRPEPGTLLIAEAPLVVEAVTLRFPGSSPAAWRTDRAESQGATGVLSDASTVFLDTTRQERTLAAPDAVLGPREVRLSGDLRAHVRRDDACFIAAGAGEGSVSLVDAAAFDGVATTITFSHPFGAAPAIGSTLRFGPWGFETIRHEFPAVGTGDPLTWRGLRLGAAGSGAGGVIVLAYNAWRPGVSGLIFGTAGRGGAGYDEQIAEAFRGTIPAWAALSAADVWIVAPAQQNSDPAVLVPFTAFVRGALPAAEVCWMGELGHGGTHDGWNAYIAANSRSAGVVGAATIEHPRLGHYLEQLADGLRSDGAHLSGRGNRIQARVWTEMLARAALDDCAIADFDGNGRRDVFDLLAFTNAWETRDDRADIDRNGAFDILDFLAYQNHVAACP